MLALALSRPREALTRARTVLAAQPSPIEASVARQSIGIVLRDQGSLGAATRELRLALELARSDGSREREADIRATLGLTAMLSGNPRRALRHLDLAVTDSRGTHTARVLMRRAYALKVLGRYPDALVDLNAALPVLRKAQDRLWQARVLTQRAETYLVLGSLTRAKNDFARAEDLFARVGQELEFAMARHNRGLAAIVEADLPTALAYLDEAGRRYARIGARPPELAIDRSAALLAAGLALDALAHADTSIATMRHGHGSAARRAELLYAAATAALAVPDLATATDRGRRARRLFVAQGRGLWANRTGLTLAQARFADGRASPALLRRVESLADDLAQEDPERAIQAQLLAGRIALALGRRADAARHLAGAGRLRTAGPLARSLAWLARALWSQAEDDSRATLSACRAGLAALDEHLLTLGSTELRAHATAHGAELAAIAQRQALRTGDGRRLLAASERWRAVALTPRAMSAPDRTALAQPLAALRAVVRQLEANRARGGPTAELERERRRLELRIRDRTLQAPGRHGRRRPFDLGELREALGDKRLVELVEVDGTLQVLTVAGRRVTRHQRAGLPVRELEHARFLLRRLAVGATQWQSTELVEQLGARLQDALLGPAVDELGRSDDPDAEVVVVPPGTLHAVPWSLLPALHDRPVSVAPSASTFLEICRLHPPAPDRVVFVAGPGLSTGAAEIDPVVSGYPGAVVLRDGTATAERVLAALDGAWLAHVAAHGSFRSDNPLFSALSVDDGPLTVHDIERLRRAPYRLLLPCCDSGVTAQVGADELLGLVSSLVPLGSAGILACIVPINDDAAVALMVALHAALRSGAGLPQALATARRQTADGPVAVATGHSFIALGR